MLLGTINVSAQVTTSAISGKIVDESDKAAIGATVVAVHQPSGTKYTAVTNDEGQYTIQGMRTGGPYKVEISYVGYQATTYNDVYLELGNTFNLDTKLKTSSQVLQEVIVSATAARKLMTGAGQNFSSSSIANTPTVSRSIYDIVKNMPMAQTNKIGGISFAGSNNRYNSFQIDGTVSNDVFGLAASGTNGGQTDANPISLDAIQEIQVVVAPYDVRQSGFTGGGINAITKQGTNEFHGDVYGLYNNQNLYGRYSAPNGYANQKLIKQHGTTLGFSLGGPIIKDKLFFFANVENYDKSYSSTYYPGSSSTYITPDMATKVLSAYNSYTGFSDTYTPHDISQKSLGILARIDWNIDNNNKFSFRYQHNNSSEDEYSSGSKSYYFNNGSYVMKDNTNSYVAELNSHLSNALYNEFRGSLSTIRDHREVPQEGPCIQIQSSSDDNNVAMYLGTEYSSGANKLNQNIYTIEDNISWYKGAHIFTFGTHNEIFHFENQFVQANNGEWIYGSLANFLSDQPSRFVYKYSLNGYIPKFNAGQFGFYAQDKWNVTKDLTLTYGLRIDIPKIFDKPATNNDFNSYAKGKFNASVGTVPSTKVMFSPRLGFRWYLDEDHNTLLRGGTGLFTGRVPFVWLSNVFTNDGVEQQGTTIYSSKTAWAPSLKTYAKDPTAAMNSASGTASVPDICTVSKKFKFPQVFRTDLAIEQKLPGDIKMTLEGLYSKTLDNVYYKNLALTQSGETYAVSGVEASAAPFYTVDTKYNSIIDLENTNKGYTYSLSAMLQKTFDFGLNTMISYTFGHSKSVFDGTSSVAYSNWQYNYTLASNDPALSYSTFDIPNRIVASIGYTTPKYLGGLLSTDVSLNYTGSNGMRYSLSMNEGSYKKGQDFNGDGSSYGNTVLYIPTKDELSKMNISSADATSFESWIEGNDYAKKHRGEYSTRNCCQAPWENHFDLHLAENIFLMKENGMKLQLTFDVINVANMLNKRWGVNYASAYNEMPLQVTGITNGVASFTYNGNNTVTKSDVDSRWHAQIGLKLIF
jgi:hypothetical protein